MALVNQACPSASSPCCLPMSQSPSLWACLGFPRFDWRLAGGRVRVDSPFELFLERRERGESWGLAQPLGSSDGLTLEWVTYPLPLDPS